MTTTPTGSCPACWGTTRQSVPEGLQRHKPNLHGYDKKSDTIPCRNCGGQTMSGRATGVVPLRADGTPCLHEFVGFNVGRCFTRYACRHCPARYEIDSGD